jgi:hypothetical protein
MVSNADRTRHDDHRVDWAPRPVRAEHVMTRFSIGRTATYRRVHELAEFGLVLRHRLLYNDGGLLTATAEGLRCAGLDRLTPARISLALVPHMIASAALAAELEPQLDDEALLSDREHRAAEKPAANRSRQRSSEVIETGIEDSTDPTSRSSDVTATRSSPSRSSRR